MEYGGSGKVFHPGHPPFPSLNEKLMAVFRVCCTFYVTPAFAHAFFPLNACSSLSLVNTYWFLHTLLLSFPLSLSFQLHPASMLAGRTSVLTTLSTSYLLTCSALLFASNCDLPDRTCISFICGCSVLASFPGS